MIAYRDELVELHHADNASVLPAIKGADLAVVDPPYGETNLPWDQLTVEWIPLVAAALAPTGMVWLWGSLRSLLAALPAAEAAGWQISQEIVWEKHDGSAAHADRFRRVRELCVLLYRGEWATTYHDPQMSADAIPRRVRRQQRPLHWNGIGPGVYETEGGGPRLLRSVMFERSSHGDSIHPTQKPVGITRSLIQYACPPDGLVLDPYAGSASTLVAARASGRRSVGVESDGGYCAAAAARLAQVPMFSGNT